jgi:heat shock protein HslJ
MIGRSGASFLVVLALVLLPICVLAEGAPALIGPTWILLEVKGTAVNVPAAARQPSLIFHATEKRVTGYSGCNEFFGSYDLNGEMMTFGPLGMTRRSCEGAEGDTESAFLQALEETRSWKIEKGMLLLLDNSRVLSRFRTGTNGAVGR